MSDVLTKELDELIEELQSRVGATLEHSPDPVAAEFYGRVLGALREYGEIRDIIDRGTHFRHLP